MFLSARPLPRRLRCPLPPPRRGLHADRSIYVSKSTNPYFNLTLEDWLFRHAPPRAPLLLLYRDAPCVVVGRNQNPWKEVNLAAAQRTGTPWVRRRSGGGTVYHDLGNTNFSLHLPRASFDRTATAQVVLRAVRALGVDAVVNARNDVCVGTDKIRAPSRPPSALHVSGSAYKIVNNRAYHHGTMLIATRLDALGDLLRTDKETMHTKGVASVRSPVRNLQQFNGAVTHEKFVAAVVDSFRTEYDIDAPIYEVEETAEATDIEYIRNGMDELPRWEWAFGQTPEFTYAVEQTFACGPITAQIRAKHGVILDCTFEAPDGVRAGLQLLAAGLAGQRYAFVDEGVLGLQEAQPAVREVWAWLKDKMAR